MLLTSLGAKNVLCGTFATHSAGRAPVHQWTGYFELPGARNVLYGIYVTHSASAVAAALVEKQSAMSHEAELPWFESYLCYKLCQWC